MLSYARVASADDGLATSLFLRMAARVIVLVASSRFTTVSCTYVVPDATFFRSLPSKAVPVSIVPGASAVPPAWSTTSTSSPSTKLARVPYLGSMTTSSITKVPPARVAWVPAARLSIRLRTVTLFAELVVDVARYA